MNRRNRDDIIYTPGVLTVRDDSCGEILMAEEDWYEMDVIPGSYAENYCKKNKIQYAY